MVASNFVYAPSFANPSDVDEGLQVGVWVPGMSESRICHITPWEGAEVAFTRADESHAIVGTSGNDPVVVLVYSVTTPASGLTEEVDTAYTQVLDAKTCALSARRPLPVAPATHGSDRYVKPTVLGYTDEIIVIGLEHEGKVFGVRAKDGNVAWQRDDLTAISRPDDTDILGPCIVSYGVSPGPHRIGSDYQFVDARDGSVAFSATESLSPTGIQFGCDSFVINGGVWRASGPNYLVTGRSETPIEGFGRAMEGRNQATRQSSNPVAIGFGLPAAGSSLYAKGDLQYVDRAGVIATVMPADRVNALGLSVHSVSGGVIYVTTTSEFVALGLDGTQIGEPIPKGEQKLTADGERFVGGRDWTLWNGLSGTSSVVAHSELPPPS